MSDEKATDVEVKAKPKSRAAKNNTDSVILEIERIEYEIPNGIDPPKKKSKPYKYTTNARHFETNFLKYHKTQGLTITKVISMPSRIKFNHKEYLEALKPKK